MIKIITLLVLMQSALTFSDNDQYKFEEINPVYLETDVGELIEIKSIADVISKRERLIAYIWGENRLPLTKRPATIHTAIQLSIIRVTAEILFTG